MEENYNDITNTAEFTDNRPKSIIKVIGVGGGGDNAVNYMFRQNIPYVNFVVCNTDEQALNMSPVPNKLVLGWDVTHGRGAGNDPAVGRQCAEASADEIRNLFDDSTEMVFITAGMGGGTGTGAAPVVARIAKEEGKLTIGIVTVPFLFEGKKKILKAFEGAKEMQKNVDALLVINNENLIEIYPDYDFFNAFEKADDTLANAARSISEIISEECYINVDFEDVKTTLKGSGTAIISTAYGEGENRISSAIRNAIHSPLLRQHDINTSQRLLLKFSCSRTSSRPITAAEMTEIYNFTSQLSDSIDVKWGIADNPDLGDKLKVTILASGFNLTLVDGNKTSKEGQEKDDNIVIFGGEHENPEVVAAQAKAVDDEIVKMYGAEKLKQQMRDANKAKYAVLEPSQFDNHEVAALLERTPAYNRPADFLEELRKTTDGKDSRMTQKPNAKDTSSSSTNVINFG
ncbi:MAG: cell division protein FtsZ [Muribaculaceae bacterium]|nr:cell division protein FtsZ [Muribaculaceae bacterium]